jgi:hypothetical protein
MNYSIHASKRLVTFSMEEAPTQGEFREFLDSLITDPVFERGFAFLGECRRCGSVLEPSIVRMMATTFRDRSGHLAPSKWAFVFLTGWGFSAVRVCSLLTHGMGLEFSAFLKPGDAERWLGVERSGLPEVSDPPRPGEAPINNLHDLRRRPGSGLHRRVLRKVS